MVEKPAFDGNKRGLGILKLLLKRRRGRVGRVDNARRLGNGDERENLVERCANARLGDAVGVKAV